MALVVPVVPNRGLLRKVVQRQPSVRRPARSEDLVLAKPTPSVRHGAQAVLHPNGEVVGEAIKGARLTGNAAKARAPYVARAMGDLNRPSAPCRVVPWRVLASAVRVVGLVRPRPIARPIPSLGAPIARHVPLLAPAAAGAAKLALRHGVGANLQAVILRTGARDS